MKDEFASEYMAWTNMKTRCYNANYKVFHRYGGRGITVCQEWRDSFKSFLSYIGPKPDASFELDRIDWNGNYEPGNVRWVPKYVGANNKECVQTLTIDGESGGLPFWEHKSRRSRKVIWRRLRDGWPAAWAVFLDPLPHKYRKINDGLAKWARENGL